MKKYFLVALAIITLIACKKNDDETTIELAEGYNYTFTVHIKSYWTEKTHPTNFPVDAGFGKILGITHESDNLLFQVGEKANTWMQPYFETNSTTNFQSYFSEYQGSNQVGDIIVKDGFKASKETSFEFTTTSDNSKVSLLMKLSPSPDWFVAISNINLDPLAMGGKVSYKVSSYDAGIFSGTTYTEMGNKTDSNISYKNDMPLNFPKGGTNKFALVSISYNSRKSVK
ncbi:MAG: hypothetical protein CSA94_01455 [Bacteroidetes bacterium]|nr:MAG: hypothetical protein CSA94_01455 [Bacteroidota bacterium]